ncbi:hypothetical protein PX52LOC_07587 [Limnoglobus roseus]|uniref:Uncharacterized protein n=1 Tax=Limnoglobus roseus TaxID=2598579 RepID=A0A5C1APH4_9BACT|nr:hypothetical protein PX52LOC_07587 [Limnoglobus roseus]
MFPLMLVTLLASANPPSIVYVDDMLRPVPAEFIMPPPREGRGPCHREGAHRRPAPTHRHDGTQVE